MMLYTKNDIARNFDAPTYARGIDYVMRGKVLAAAFNGKSIEGNVEGSGGQRYRQSIKVMQRSSLGFNNSCTCPMVNNCKHVVAVLLRYLQLAQEQPAAAPDGSLSPVLALWLSGLARAIEPKPPVKRAGATAQAMYRLVYVLMPNGSGRLDLHLCRARLRAGGVIVSATVLANLYDIRHRQPVSMSAAER